MPSQKFQLSTDLKVMMEPIVDRKKSSHDKN